jgi:hypothetical protein
VGDLSEFSSHDWRLLQNIVISACSGRKDRFRSSLRDFDEQVHHGRRVTAWVRFLVLYVVLHQLGRYPTDEDLRDLGRSVEHGYRGLLHSDAPPATDLLLFIAGRLPVTDDLPGPRTSPQLCALLAQFLVDPETDLLDLEPELISHWRQEGPKVARLVEGQTRS